MRRIFFKVFIMVFALAFTSCEKETPVPGINILELGMENSKIAYIGADLHIEAEIIAEAKISKIVLTIHPENGDAQKVISQAQETIEWKVDSIYTGKYSGVKNCSFHEHIEIPENAKIGDYHLHLMVVDMDGKSTQVEAEFELQKISN